MEGSARVRGTVRRARAGVWCEQGALACPPGKFQAAVSVLGLGTNKFISVLFKCGVSVFHSPSEKACLFSYHVRGFIFPMLYSRVGFSNMGLNLLFLGETLQAGDMPLIFWITY